VLFNIFLIETDGPATLKCERVTANGDATPFAFMAQLSAAEDDGYGVGVGIPLNAWHYAVVVE